MFDADFCEVGIYQSGWERGNQPNCHSLSRILGKLHTLGSTASAYLDGAGSPDLLPADGDGPDVPTDHWDTRPGKLCLLNREERAGSLVAQQQALPRGSCTWALHTPHFQPLPQWILFNECWKWIPHGCRVRHHIQQLLFPDWPTTQLNEPFTTPSFFIPLKD